MSAEFGPLPSDRSLADVLSPDEVELLEDACREVASMAPMAERMALLLDLSRQMVRAAHEGPLQPSEARTLAVVTTALAVDPEAVERLLCGCMAMPGTRARIEALCWERYGALWLDWGQPLPGPQRLAKRKRQRQRASATWQARPPAFHERRRRLPDGWLDRARGAPVGWVLERLGIEVRGGSFGPCPHCGAEKRGSHDRRDPVIVGTRRNVFYCYACERGGGPVDLVAKAVTGDCRWHDGRGAALVYGWFEDNGAF